MAFDYVYFYNKIWKLFPGFNILYGKEHILYNVNVSVNYCLAL